MAACGRTQPLRDTGFSGGSGGAGGFQGAAAGAGGGLADPPPGCELTGFEVDTLPEARRRPIDVLFVVDDSCSMGDDQEKLASNFSSFFTDFRARQVDFHLGVVTTDMRAANRSGRLVAPFLTNTTPNLDQAFTSMVSVGTHGSSIEQGLGAASAALHDPLLSGTNKGFIRADADLALVFFGDEDDQSAVSMSTFATDLRSLKPVSSITVASMIGLDDGWLCFPGVVGGWRLAQFTRLFAPNSMLAVCRADYAGMLRAIGGRIVSSQCVVGLRWALDQHKHVRITVNGEPNGFVVNRPDENYPHGSIEVDPCPESGGILQIAYDDCD